LAAFGFYLVDAVHGGLGLKKRKAACVCAVIAAIAFLVLLARFGIWSPAPWVALLVVGFFGGAAEDRQAT
jgi:hypothetical protein